MFSLPAISQMICLLKSKVKFKNSYILVVLGHPGHLW